MMPMTGIARILAVPTLCLASLTTTALAESPDANAATDSNAPARAVFAKYCNACHVGEKSKGGVDLEKLLGQGPPAGRRKPWQRVKENVEAGTMPPDDKPQPSMEESHALLAWLDAELKKIDCGQATDPGRVTIRRLNRVEYDNTIRDLLGVDFHPADDFPSDDVGYGFDNIGDVLSLPPILMEKYLVAAETIAEQAVVSGSNARPLVKAYDASSLTAGGGDLYDDARILGSDGEVAVAHDFPRDSSYIIRVRAYGQQAGDEPAKMAIRVDGKALKTFEVAARAGAAGTYEHRETIRGGARRVGAAFLNDFYDPDNPDAERRDRNLVVESIEIEGPLSSKDDPLPESHTRLIFRTPTKPEEFPDCASAILEKFMTRAFRRPVTGGEVSKLVRLVEMARENGDNFERGIQLAVQAALVSPQFLFRVELYHPKRDKKGKVVKSETGAPLNAFEIASRLSYFLWSSMPDDELFMLARDGSLLKDDVLEAQVGRMIRDPKSRAFVENFAGQWLQLRLLKTANPDRGQYAFDEPLREAMQRESELFFAGIMREDRSILEFLDSDYTFLNERLARHYGIPGVEGPEFRRVTLKGKERGGLITQASVLTVTSNASRTSPVKRGKWVLEQILGAAPPPAPPNVPQLSDETKDVLSGTLRQRMEKHRSDPSCASCHSRLDPPGFGLENYDAVGAWRTKEGDFPIDASSSLPTGESFNGAAELKALLLKTRKDEFVACLAEKMLTYALGRGLEDYDACTVQNIAKDVSADGHRFSRMVLEIVKSDPFRKRRG
jgi:mono/diheme cytochrome c family protein